ncbi:hypothetical protein VMCG_04734 [Cytospora schulzeri]|uniref:Uncharacterized protein n=1 Tax=Cytospora schulzeri TaxID=448051 RepID=A0A423WMM2_9PEZI|nr:hypothetical protein VMCG_04734 [Valsa malicola]
MVSKVCMSLASAMIRALQPQVLNCYTALNAFRHQRKGPASSLGPSIRWAAAAIASLAIIWFFWSLQGQSPQYDSAEREVDMAQEVGYTTVTAAKSQFFANSGSLRSNSRPMSKVDHTEGVPSVELTGSLQPGSLHLKIDQSSTDDAEEVERSDRPLILYAYAESENARANLEFFLKKGLHGKADFVFIFNGEAPEAVQLIPTKRSNVRVVQRDNTCYDIGSFGKVLRSQIKVGGDGNNGKGVPLWHRYKWFITMNASIRGPFLPVWSEECWTDAFLRKVTDDTKLVGLSYHCNPSPHLQSMLLATDHIGMSILLDPALAFSVPNDDPPHGTVDDPVGYSRCYEQFDQAVHSEIGMARLIRSQGYKVDAMLTSVHILGAADYCQKAAYPTDHLWDGMYFGFNVHPYEMLFMKTNRDIDPELVKRMTEWHLRSPASSWDTCGW